MVKMTQEVYDEIMQRISDLIQETPCVRYGQAFAIIIHDYPELSRRYTDLQIESFVNDMWEVKDPVVVHEFINKNFLA